MATYTLIESQVLGSSAASVTFSAIPATYTDLVLRVSARSSSVADADAIRYRFNSDTTSNYSFTVLQGLGTSAASSRESNYTFNGRYFYAAVGGTSTSDTFGNGELYIPSYTANQYKPISEFGVEENNATTANMNVGASLWRNTAAINTIYLYLQSAANFVTDSSFYLYGIKNS